MEIGDGIKGGNGVLLEGSPWLWRTYGVQESDGSVVSTVGSTKRAYSRHQGKANVVFCNGHVESPKLTFLFEAPSDDALRRWNRDHQPHRELLQQ